MRIELCRKFRVRGEARRISRGMDIKTRFIAADASPARTRSAGC